MLRRALLPLGHTRASMTAPSNVIANATGRLESLPLCELLAYALYRRLTGSFVLEAPEREPSTLVVRSGHVVKVHTKPPLEQLAEFPGQLLLGEMLVSSGELSRPTLERALALAAQNEVRLGHALIALNARSPSALAAALREQLLRRVALVACLPSTSSFGFYSALDLLREQPVVEADPLALIARAVRQAPPEARIQLVCERLRGHTLRLAKHAEPGRFELSPEQRKLVGALARGPRALAQLEAEYGLPLSRELIYLLVLTRQLQVSSGSSTDAPRSARPSGISLKELGAAEAFRLAEESLKRHQLHKAIALAEHSCALDREQPECQALLAWLYAQRDDVRSMRAAHPSLFRLNQAIRTAPNNPRIRYYRGQLFKRVGRMEDALRDFRFCARQDPKHVDAVRELRLHAMRSQPPPAKNSGVFSKFFGR
jgi:tetratricopeptide (TPR) repeat protein